MTKYEIIYADPPWDYKGQTQHNGKGGKDTGGAVKHYPCMKLRELKELNVPSICEDNSLLFLWTSSPHLNQAIELMEAWGFNYATVAFVWDKQKVNPGFYTMSQCELVLVGKRGTIPKPRGSRNTRQLHSELRGKHSAKPKAIRDKIVEMFPTQTKVELFARENVEGWKAFGNEIDDSINI